MDTILKLDNISYSYVDGEKNTISNFSLDIERGSFTTLLGPSGCGKTTLLRLISGFISPLSGSIILDGINQVGIEPDKRALGMVFQDYALFPHMKVGENIMYGLKIQSKKSKINKDEMYKRVEKTAKSLDLSSFLDRFPHELSGGQQQRVALARSLVLNPRILLMDEPLSSLDTKLQLHVREELKEIQERFGITTIYVTHNQEEALYLSNKIALINEGKLIQYSSPSDIYFKPKNSFVADFMGGANFITDENKTFVVRPEWFSIVKGGSLNGIVKACSFLGERTVLKVEIDKEEIKVSLPTLSCREIKKNDAISLNIDYKYPIEEK